MDNLTRQPAQKSVATVRLPAGVEPIMAALAHLVDGLQFVRADARRVRFIWRERDTGSAVQLIVLQPGLASDGRQRELFYLEAYAAAKLTHFNITRTGRPQEVNGVHFYVIEQKTAARTLRDLLNRNGWLAMDVACDIADQIAGALDYAHGLNVLHLQLSPECVLIEPNDWVMVGGFGIEIGPRLEWAHSERARRLAATYASVEQANGAACDARSDLYSLGAMLYEMLTDRVPFDSDDEEYVRERQLEFTPAPPHLISLEVPEAVSEVVMKLLEKEPQNRFSSAAEFQVALDEALHGKSATA